MMAKFDSTIFPQTNEPEEIQKMGIDLLDKINKTAGASPYQFTLEAAYTPTFTGFGTVSAVNFTWCRAGNKIKISGYFTAGTTTGVIAKISLPSGKAIDYTINQTMVRGNLIVSVVQASSFYCLSDPGSADAITIGIQNAGAGALLSYNGNAIAAGPFNASINAEIPISGWNV